VVNRFLERQERIAGNPCLLRQRPLPLLLKGHKVNNEREYGSGVAGMAGFKPSGERNIGIPSRTDSGQRVPNGDFP
jgi:hypothetical protein